MTNIPKFSHCRSDESSTEGWYRKQCGPLSHRRLSHILSPLIQHSSMWDTECILSAATRMFSSRAISCAGRHPVNRHVNRLRSKPWRRGTGDSRGFNLHSHLSNENTKLRLAEPALHHSAYMWLRLHVALLRVWIPASVGVFLHMYVSTAESQSDTQSVAF